ncbi:MAG: GNAT family N-acetyltransferase [Methanohalobium sp.]|uniref:GNAT family N-acetyltransferase n=1 Tax=Methanohalobium sp. TaxID=2837493 RepID=UPI00397BD023
MNYSNLNGFEILHRAGDIVYAVPNSSGSIDELDIDVDINNGFSYFQNRFAIPYRYFLKTTIDSGHRVIVAVSHPNVLAGFARFEEYNPYQCYLLRSIEVNSSYRQKGIGKSLLAIAFVHLGAHVTTKPDNKRAQIFFKKLGFMDIRTFSGFGNEEFRGYLILPSHKAVSLLWNLVQKYPRVVYPELVSLYEKLQFKFYRGKPIMSEDVHEFKKLFNKYNSFLDDGSFTRMNCLLFDIQKKDNTYQ